MKKLLLLILLLLPCIASTQEKVAIAWDKDELKGKVKSIFTTELISLAADTSLFVVQGLCRQQYSPEGLITKKERMRSDSTLTEVESYEYDTLQRLIKKTSFFSYASQAEVDVYIYDADGNGGDHKRYQNDELIFNGEFTYPFDWHKRLQTPLRATQELSDVDNDYEFDGYIFKYRKTEYEDVMTTYDSLGNVKGTATWIFDSKDRLLEYSECHNDTLSKYKAFSYDVQDRLIKESWKFEDEEGIYAIRYKYDDNGNMIELTDIFNDIFSVSEIYEYDKQGNWIKAIKPREESEEEIFIIKRQFEYYD